MRVWFPPNNVYCIVCLFKHLLWLWVSKVSGWGILKRWLITQWSFWGLGLTGRQIIEPWVSLCCLLCSVFCVLFGSDSDLFQILFCDSNAYMRFLLWSPTICLGPTKKLSEWEAAPCNYKTMNESLKCDVLMGCQCCEWIRWTH